MQRARLRVEIGPSSIASASSSAQLSVDQQPVQLWARVDVVAARPPAAHDRPRPAAAAGRQRLHRRRRRRAGTFAAAPRRRGGSVAASSRSAVSSVAVGTSTNATSSNVWPVPERRPRVRAAPSDPAPASPRCGCRPADRLRRPAMCSMPIRRLRWRAVDSPCTIGTASASSSLAAAIGLDGVVGEGPARRQRRPFREVDLRQSRRRRRRRSRARAADRRSTRRARSRTARSPARPARRRRRRPARGSGARWSALQPAPGATKLPSAESRAAGTRRPDRSLKPAVLAFDAHPGGQRLARPREAAADHERFQIGGDGRVLDADRQTRRGAAGARPASRRARRCPRTGRRRGRRWSSDRCRRRCGRRTGRRPRRAAPASASGRRPAPPARRRRPCAGSWRAGCARRSGCGR